MIKSHSTRLATKVVSNQSKLIQNAPEEFTPLRVNSSGDIFFLSRSAYYNDKDLPRDLTNFQLSLFKINTSGAIDSSFMANAGQQADGIRWFAIDPTNNDIVIVGDFTTWNGASCPAGIVKINSSGSVVSSFSTNLGTGLSADRKAYFFGPVLGVTGDIVVEAVNVGEAGDLITLTGDGTSTLNTLISAWNSANPTNTAALTSGTGTEIPNNGEIISLFDGGSGPAEFLFCSISATGKIFVTGFVGRVNTTTAFRGGVMLNQNGTLDTTFNASMGWLVAGFGLNGRISASIFLSDSSIVFTGRFFNYFSGFPYAPTGVGFAANIGKLSSSGAVDATFDSNAGVGFDDDVDSLPFIDSSNNIYICSYAVFNNNYYSNGGPLKLSSVGVVDVGFFVNTNCNAGGFTDGQQVVDLLADGSSLVNVGFIGSGNLPATTGSYTGTPSGCATAVTITANYAGESFAPFEWFFDGVTSINDAIASHNASIITYTVTLTSGNGAQIPDNTAVILVNGTSAPQDYGDGFVKMSTAGILDATFTTNTGTGSSNGATTIAKSGSNYYFGNQWSLGNSFNSNTNYGPLGKMSSAGIYDQWVYPVAYNNTWLCPAGVTSIDMDSQEIPTGALSAVVTPGTTYTITDITTAFTLAGIRYTAIGFNGAALRIWWVD